MRKWVFFAFCVLAACVPNAGSQPVDSPVQRNIALLYSFVPGAASSSAQPLVLYDPQFLDTSHAAYYIFPQGVDSLQPIVSYSSSGSSITLQHTQPFSMALPGIPVPTAPPGGTFITVGNTYGEAVVSAKVTAPLNATATLTVVHYPSLSFGCRFRFNPAFSFDKGIATVNSTTSDLYDTEASDELSQLDPCWNTQFASPVGATEVWHTPYGGRFIATTSLEDFAGIHATDWQDTSQTFPPAAGVLIFKTRGGRVVKALLPLGPYEISGDDGSFPY